MEWFVGLRRAVSKYFKTADLLDFHTLPSLGFTENSSKKRKYPVSGSCVDENTLLMSEVRGEWADWLEMMERQRNLNITTSLVTTKVCRIPSLKAQHFEPWSRWATAAEDHTGCRSCQLRTGKGGYNSHQNWTIKDWKNVAWSDESWFLLQHSDGRVRIWRKEHESMYPSCLVSTVQAGGDSVMVWGIFSWHTLGPLVPIQHCLNTTAYLSIVADHVHPFMTTVYPSSDGYFQQDNAPCHKSSNHLRLVSWTWKWVHFTQMASIVTRS